MIRAYRASFADMGSVTELDWRTQEFALGPENIKQYFLTASRGAYLAKVSTKHVGFACVTFDQFVKDKPAGGIVHLNAIGTLQDFRRHHIATKIIERIDIEARNAENPFHRMQMLVPAYQADDMQDPWNIEHWLWKVGFKALKSITGACSNYGGCDYYLFERRIT
jgi:hypothetical protein